MSSFVCTMDMKTEMQTTQVVEKPEAETKEQVTDTNTDWKRYQNLNYFATLTKTIRDSR